MRQPDQASTSTLSLQAKRKTVAICRDYCQGRILIGKEPQSGLKQEEHKLSQLDLIMKQPSNIGMFYGLRDSRT
ncbi:hypothetical protein VIOR3934_16496 [Vibrio orientalis CIP 102891 = ATCC 33934]|uniref:Uncharacterized protein n=1 Tax=Vibrio orientalis CIP 102891 = ATCC 33934 TaxID=675816 RepID=F9SXZ7_VIBOR|nr:hypothetical protein VIOR3934_16496 [Vibrio orientalis CIP 102891 = ATCC 33934]